MADPHQRLLRTAPPALAAERAARYRLAAPLIARSATWCDLGCGDGSAAAAALGEAGAPAGAVLVDAEEGLAREAARAIGAAGAAAVGADLESPEGLAAVRDRVLVGEGERVVTCFGLLERVSVFVGVVELLVELATEHDATVLLSVPNTVELPGELPRNGTIWGESAFAELRRMLPVGHVLLRQIVLQGSAILPAGREEAPDAHVAAAAAAPSHLLAAFGPGAASLSATSVLAAVDLRAQRAWEDTREAELRFLQAP